MSDRDFVGGHYVRWSYAKSPEQMLDEKDADIERLNNRIAYLQHEMKRHLPILETLHASAYEWETCAAGTGVATLNGYRAALNTEERE